MKNNNSTKAIIVGAGVAGKELYFEIKKHFKKRYQVLGLIDDDPKKQGKKIYGLEVLSDIKKLSSVIKKLKVEEVFIAIPSAQGSLIRRIIDQCQKEKVIFRIVPRILEIIQGRVKLNQVREVQIEDLLGRAIVKSEQPLFKKFFKDKNILVTGGAGSIGSELCRQLIQFRPNKLVIYDWWENGIFDLDQQLQDITKKNNFVAIVGNIQDIEKVSKVIKDNDIEMIFHAAAFKHVPLMQYYPEEAIKNNIFGTENLAKVAVSNQVERFIFISSDKAANPVSIMGATKFFGEQIIASYHQKARTKFSAVRFGNVLGSLGSVVPTFRKQISNGGPVTVTDPNMIRFFMTIPEAVQLILYASCISDGGEIFILEMGDPVRIDDLARLMIRLAGFIPDVDIPIKYIGRRPGEKFAETLTFDTENLEKTSHQKINKIKLIKINDLNLESILNKLQKIISTNDQKQIFKIVEDFAPNLEYTTKE